MKRVVVIHWKNKGTPAFEIFSNLKILCASYQVYNYNTLNNYLSKNKMPYENNDVKIERKTVQTSPLPSRQMSMVANRIKMHGHDEEKQNRDYWLSRPVGERLDAVKRLSAQLKKHPDERMDKTIHRKRKMR